MSIFTALLAAGAMQSAPHPFLNPDVPTLTKYYDLGREWKKRHKSLMEAQDDWNKDFGERRTDQKRSRITIYTPKCLALTAGYTDEMNFVPHDEGLAAFLKSAEKPVTSIKAEFDLYDWQSASSHEPRLRDEMGFALLVDGKDPIRASDKVETIPLEKVTFDYTKTETYSEYDSKTHRRVRGREYVPGHSHGEHIRFEATFPVFRDSGEPFFTDKAKSVEVRAFNVKYEGKVSFGLKDL